MTEITVAVPMPPSVNQLYANVGRRRVKTALARRWHRNASWMIKLEAKGQQIQGPWAIGVVLPRSMRGDPDNRLKAILDAAVASGTVADDRYCVAVNVERTGEAPDVQITLRPAS
jgi:crossover junction endodeoxyribonuclease RusA